MLLLEEEVEEVIGGWGEHEATTIAERTMLLLMTVMMGIMD